MAANPQILNRVFSKLQSKSRMSAMQTSLSLRHWLSGQTLWVDYGCVKLPFHGDDDKQELLYHLHCKEWWDHEAQVIAPYVRPGDVVVDVGANLGFMSAIFSTLTGKTGQVHSFEPSPAVYAKLQEVLQANGCTNVTTYNAGCGDKEGSMTLYSPSSSGNATLRPGEEMKQSSVEERTVSIVVLDDFLGPKLERLDFLKIDTEGFEPEVLAGAVRLLERLQPVIYIELGSLYSSSSAKAVEILRSLGYTLPQEAELDRMFSGDNFFALPPKFVPRAPAGSAA